MIQNNTNQSFRKCKLIMVSNQNNNKYYEMEEQSNGSFKVMYGRVGTQGSVAEYPITLWHRKYNEKIRKGYQDLTHLFKDSQEPEVAFEDIDETHVYKLMKDLYQFANKSVQTHYNVTASDITRKQLDEAQDLLNELAERIKPRMRKQAFNQLLIKLYGILPRKMKNVNEHLIQPKMKLEDIRCLIASEQETLDVMRGQFDMLEEGGEQAQEKISILSKLGISIEEETTKSSIRKIKKLMGVDSALFYKAYRVTNNRTANSFNQLIQHRKHKKTALFWHGSRNENWMSILGSGLVLRPTNAVITGKMFGYGLYFADKFKKSLNYTSFRGAYWSSGSSDKAYLALYEVHIGKQLKTKNHESWHYSLDKATLQSKGDYDSLFAKGGADLMNNEYVIYDNAQCTIKYLVEIKK